MPSSFSKHQFTVSNEYPPAVGENHYDNYVIKLTFPELKITDPLRIVDSVLNVPLSSDSKRLLVLQGMDDQERILFFDAANLKPLQ